MKKDYLYLIALLFSNYFVKLEVLKILFPEASVIERMQNL